MAGGPGASCPPSAWPAFRPTRAPPPPVTSSSRFAARASMATTTRLRPCSAGGGGGRRDRPGRARRRATQNAGLPLAKQRRAHRGGRHGGRPGPARAYHRRQLGAEVIAVVGSNGKTTTKAMIHHILSGRLRGRCSPKSYNNAIGVPLTLLSAQQGDEYLVVEIARTRPARSLPWAPWSSRHGGPDLHR